MKWIGQHIWDLISRFRNDVYIDEKVYDGSSSAGSVDQVLTSTGTEVKWKTLSSLGGSDKHYTHAQTVVSDEWSVEHNLEKFPSVVCVLDNGYEFVPHVEHVDTNTLTIYLNGADRGKAYCN